MTDKAPTPTTFEEANDLGLKIAVMLAQLTNAGCIDVQTGVAIVSTIGEGVDQRFGEDEPDPDAIKADVEDTPNG